MKFKILAALALAFGAALFPLLALGQEPEPAATVTVTGSAELNIAVEGEGANEGDDYFLSVEVPSMNLFFNFFWATPQPPPSPPTAIADLAAASGDELVTLTWSAATGATSYDLYRSLTSGTGFSLVASGVSSGHEDTGRTNGTEYFYFVRANGDGGSTDSNEDSATPVPAGPTPLASYDATIVDSVTLDGSNNVEQWDDQSGNDRHATQTTSSERPGYTSGVSIDPQSGDSLDIDSLDIGSEHDIFVVYKYESGFPLFFGPRVDGFTYTRIDNGGGVYYRAGSSILSWFTGAFPAGDWHILRFQRSAGAVTLYRNGVSQGQKTGTLNDFSFTEVVGVSASGVCNAGSVRVYDALSDEDAATVTEELATQFGITLP